MDPLAEDRLEDALDVQRSVQYEGSVYSYQPTFHWGTGDFGDNYPVIALGYQTEASERTEEQPVGDLLSYDPREGETESDFHRGARVLDEIQCTVAQEAGFDGNRVPAHVMVQQVCKSLWKQVKFGLDLNVEGPNGEPPMLFDVAGSPSGPYRQDDTVRANFVLGAAYTEVYTESVDSVADAETEVNTN